MKSVLERYSKLDVYGSLLEISNYLRSQRGIKTRLSRVRIPRKLKKKLKKELNLRLGFTILKGKKLVVVSREKYHQWYECADPHLEDSYIQNVRISTVFLPHGKLTGYNFETMIFGGALDGKQWRYATYGQAKHGHNQALGEVRQSLNQ